MTILIFGWTTAYKGSILLKGLVRFETHCQVCQCKSNILSSVFVNGRNNATHIMGFLFLFFILEGKALKLEWVIFLQVRYGSNGGIWKWGNEWITYNPHI